jgi:3-hydroxyacyl-CoA dehydrogenase/enoyl-CoA hydratase/3-hydroxybutyryl-CoA epimerase
VSDASDASFAAETIRWDAAADGVVTLTLDDPSAGANTMNEAYRRSMGAVLERLRRERDAITGVIVTSAKSTFFAGGNLDDLIKAGPDDRAAVLAMVLELRGQLRALETLGVPVVAAVNGTALGGGLEIALACHHRVVLDGPRTRLGFPEVTLGLLPGAGGVVRSVRLLGLATALTELLLRGQQVRPAKALELGLVDGLAADPEELLAKARAYIAAHPGPEARQRFDAQGWRVPGGTPSSPGLASMLPAFPATLVKQLKGANLPAPHHILCAAVEGLQVDVETALTVENRYFIDLVCGQISTNMIQAFWFDLNAVNGGASRPADVPRRVPTRVAVLGAGMMGAGIAHALARSGLEVVLKDVSLEAAERGKAHARKLLDADLANGRTTAQERDAVLGRITPAADPGAVAGCEAVIEAVFEDQALKHRVFGEVEHLLTPDALLGSNTSTLPITGLATGVSRPEAFIGLHFFSPVDRMPLVEIIVGEKTSDETLGRAYDLVRAIGKTPIVVNDSRGFFTSRVFGTLVLEGAALLGEGLPPMSLERAAQQTGFPAGPLTLMDEVTLTLMLKIEDSAADAADAEGRPRPVEHPGTAVVRRMIENGRTGRSAGAGFFDWPRGGGVAGGKDSKRVWPGLARLFPVALDPATGAPAIGAAALVEAQERLLFVMAVETARCLQEGVLRTVADANIGSIMGIGFPPQFGGVLQYVDQYPGGAAGFVARANELADRYGERFRPPALLTERAATAGSLRAAL